MNSSVDLGGGARLATSSLSAGTQQGTGSPATGSAGASAFRDAMESASRRAVPEPQLDAIPKLDASLMVSPRARSVGEVAIDASIHSLEARFATIQREGLDLGAGFDASQPASAVIALERQVRLSKSVLEYQAILQAADNVKSAVKQLVQMQS
jgi:hypothetical protein